MALERCQQAEAAEPELLPTTLTHDCGEWCVPCTRCGHHDGRHVDGIDDCQVGGCNCSRWLCDTDCPDCDGSGERWGEIEVAGGAVREVSVACPDCGGTGTTGGKRCGWAR